MNPTLSSPPPRIVVLGSLNMDIVLRVPHAPDAGETLQGRSITNVPGGKGGNQAVGCARQGARVQLVGCVGDDAHGRALRDALAGDGIDTAAVRVVPDAPTGTALVMVDDAAQNRIVVIAGANAQLEIDEAALATQLAGAAFLVTQFETPLAQVGRALQVAQRSACKVMLNPSPMQPVDDAWWPLIDTLVVNEVEARMLAGLPADTPTEAAAAGQALRARGVARVVVTLGAQGAVAVDATGARHHGAPVVKAVDTTAAGDTFLGALAVALGSGNGFDAAVGLGIRAAALCVTQPGAQPSIPQRDAVLRHTSPTDWTVL
ncbi:ribokinase [Variovorax ginsengisoli]|uniref:Ribokinase n=1 Tax=Variovorax ginsengisoli TaxID=363844 RepID=A0ABT9S4N3_9BURK|nr:ribokinase [Variovorax ginsengisoli]MDP9898327.1 ribokinase [Variovorax ginsengisoli]